MLPDQLRDRLRDILEDEDGVIWLAGLNGIVRLEDGRLTRFEVPAAIDRTVHAIVPDGHGRVWLPTNAGLVRVDREQRTTERSEANASLEETARRDALTGLLNRRGFLELAQREVVRARRGKTALSIVLLDIDHFKRVNDSHGHAVGDETLRVLSGVLVASVRNQDLVGRWGGEEFVLLLPETSVAGAAMVAEKIRRSVAEQVQQTGAKPPPVTVTLGVTELGDSRSLDEAVHRADVALYQGKAAGRNRVVEFEQSATT